MSNEIVRSNLKRESDDVEDNIHENKLSRKGKIKFKFLRTCEYWMIKKNRKCLTPVEEGQDYCDFHKLKEIKQGITLEKTEPDSSKTNLIILSSKNNSELLSCSVEENSKNKCCKFWVERKRRFCKAAPFKNFQYCIEHAPLMNVDIGRTRVPCPYDNSHFCYEDKLESHLKRCNQRPALRQMFYEEYANVGEQDDTLGRMSIKDFELEELLKIIAKLTSLHSKYEGLICENFFNHQVLSGPLQDPNNGPQAKKHLLQISSLIGAMENKGLLGDNISFVEFGAGRGGLSHWLQLSTNELSDCQYLLVDRSSVRYKKDSYHRGEDQGPTFNRIKIPIEHLVLNKVDELKENKKKVVGVGKHLCGNATDYMLRCLLNSRDHIKLGGLIVALCCHHRCSWGAHVGRNWLLGEGFGEREFVALVRMSAWATCGFKHNEEENKNEISEFSSFEHSKCGSLSAKKKEEIGFKCKNLLDFGRVKYLESMGLEVSYFKYVSPLVTLENLALLATPLSIS